MLNYEKLTEEITSSETVEYAVSDRINSQSSMPVGTVDFEDRELVGINSYSENKDGGGHGEATISGDWSAVASGDLADGASVGNSATARVEFTHDENDTFAFKVLDVEAREPFDDDV